MTTKRVSRTVCITMPPDLLKEMESLKKKHKMATNSEFFRMLLREHIKNEGK